MEASLLGVLFKAFTSPEMPVAFDEGPRSPDRLKLGNPDIAEVGKAETKVAKAKSDVGIFRIEFDKDEDIARSLTSFFKRLRRILQNCALRKLWVGLEKLTVRYPKAQSGPPPKSSLNSAVQDKHYTRAEQALQ
jgi:hypothetical protein